MGRRPSLIASKQGKAKIEAARRTKGWKTQEDDRPLRRAAEFLATAQLKATSKTHKDELEAARRLKGWQMEGDDRPLRRAADILELTAPDTRMPDFALWQRFLKAEEPIASEVFKAFCQMLELDWRDAIAPASGTWRRFLEAKQPVDVEFFKAFCQALDLNWETLINHKTELSQAPDLTAFFGRDRELRELTQKLTEERCRLVLIHGNGGIGKTALARKLVDTLEGKFDYVIWRSLDYVPTRQDLIADLIQALSEGQLQTGDLAQLMHYLRQSRCLIVLDDWETVMDTAKRTPQYRPDYEDYSELLKRLARETHRSSLLILSREKPVEVDLEASQGQPVYARQLKSLTYDDTKAMARAEGLIGSASDLEEFSRRYSNPFIIKLVARRIRSVFEGDISHVLEDVSLYLDDAIATFLHEQFQQLSRLEKTIIYWLAIRRKPTPFEHLLADITPTISRSELTNTLHYLIEGRSLVEKSQDQVPVTYSLDPVMLKYTTNQFIELSCNEILQAISRQTIQGSELLISHTFIPVVNIDQQLQAEQTRRIFQPIQTRLLSELQSKSTLIENLKSVFSLIDQRSLVPYASQNLANLCEQ